VLAKSDPEYDALGDTSNGCILSVTGTANQGLRRHLDGLKLRGLFLTRGLMARL
jgi:hypothetical protein